MHVYIPAGGLQGKNATCTMPFLSCSRSSLSSGISLLHARTPDGLHVACFHANDSFLLVCTAAGGAIGSSREQQEAKLLKHKTVMKFSSIDRSGVCADTSHRTELQAASGINMQTAGIGFVPLERARNSRIASWWCCGHYPLVTCGAGRSSSRSLAVNRHTIGYQLHVFSQALYAPGDCSQANACEQPRHCSWHRTGCTQQRVPLLLTGLKRHFQLQQ